MGFSGQIIMNAKIQKLSGTFKNSKDFKDAAHAVANAVHMDAMMHVRGVETVAAVPVESVAFRTYVAKYFSIAKIQTFVAVYGT